MLSRSIRFQIGSGTLPVNLPSAARAAVVTLGYSLRRLERQQVVT